MDSTKLEYEFETRRLEQAISLAKEQLEQARQNNEENKSAIISAKQELRDNTQHSIGNLWSGDGFEALAALSQYVNPVLTKISEFEATENKMLLLKNLIKAPYFARIDFMFDGEDEYEKIYIGRSSLMDDDSCEMYVYDWRSPIASMFYRFVTGKSYYDAPDGKIAGEINLKRQYEINNGVLEYFFDADVQIIDEFLRKLLSKNASPKMKSVVETIQKEQDIVIRDMENDLMMMQGVAGSGKTSIALHRIAYLMYQGLSSRLSVDNIVIISPNALFEQYVSGVLPELGEDNVISMVFEDMASEILNNSIQSRNQFLEDLITSSQYRDIIKNSIDFKTSPCFLEIINRFIEDIPLRWMTFEDVYYNGQCIASKDMLKNKILTGRKETPLGVKLKQLKEYILEEHNIEGDIQGFIRLNITHLYRMLFRSRRYFHRLCIGIELPPHINDILTFTQENLESHFLRYDDVIAMTFFTLKINGVSNYKHIKQVVIDEAQDYYPLHYEIFKLMFPNAKYTILGDINQTLEKQEDISLYEQIKKILNKKKASLVTLDKSFRCTNQILAYSSKFISNDFDIKSFNRDGDEPTVNKFEDKNSFKEAVAAEVNYCLANGYKSVGLVCKTEKNAVMLYELLKDKIDAHLIKDGASEYLQGVFIIPVYMAKGLEFDAVLICDVDNENYSNDDDKKLLYIACTRALHRLNLFCQGEASLFL